MSQFTASQAVRGMQLVFFGTLFIWTVAVTYRCWTGTGYICNSETLAREAGEAKGIYVVNAIEPADVKKDLTRYLGQTVTLVGAVTVGEYQCETTNTCDKMCCNACKGTFYLVESDDYRVLLNEKVQNTDRAAADAAWAAGVKNAGIELRAPDGTSSCTRTATMTDDCPWQCPSDISEGKEYTMTGVVGQSESKLFVRITALVPVQLSG